MVKVIVIDKGGNVKCSSIKNFDIELLHKKCNLKNKEHFEKRTSWEFDTDHNVTLFSKDNGRANSENKYDLPPPVDDKLYFGNMILVKHTDKVIQRRVGLLYRMMKKMKNIYQKRKKKRKKLIPQQMMPKKKILWEKKAILKRKRKRKMNTKNLMKMIMKVILVQS